MNPVNFILLIGKRRKGFIFWLQCEWGIGIVTREKNHCLLLPIHRGKKKKNYGVNGGNWIFAGNCTLFNYTQVTLWRYWYSATDTVVVLTLVWCLPFQQVMRIMIMVVVKREVLPLQRQHIPESINLLRQTGWQAHVNILGKLSVVVLLCSAISQSSYMCFTYHYIIHVSSFLTI